MVTKKSILQNKEIRASIGERFDRIRAVMGEGIRNLEINSRMLVPIKNAAGISRYCD